MESLYNWNVQIFPTITGSLQVLRSPGLRLGGVRLCNIKPLHRTTHTDEDTIKLKIGLINSRSVMNKTFLLNDFFTAQGLDFMFITETWITSGDMSPFSELIPRDCNFYNTPCSSGRGGGLASIFKEKFNCRLIATEECASFERQLLLLDIGSPVAIAIIYRPQKAQKDFINEFGFFLGGLFQNLIDCSFKVILIYMCATQKMQ